jgi:hypothetical protein
MSTPDQERDPPIRSTYNKVLRIFENAGLSDTDLLTVFDMLDDHIAETRRFILESRKADDCWDEGPAQ